MPHRRDLLKLVGAAGVLSAASSSVIAKALAAPMAAGGSGTLMDVEHVVILMQENRSFDHYFGTLRGVRGFDDPRAVQLPSGEPVWRQPKSGDRREVVTPFHLDAASTRAENLDSLDHSWKGSHDRWKHHDAWIPAKSPMTMGYFKRDDIPFYYALADAFTICDAYHCSMFGPTNPNRLYLFTGTSGLTVGATGPLAVTNPGEEINETADPANDAADWAGFGWTTYAERLEAAGVHWKVYQEHDNYGDNALAYFGAFRGPEANPALRDKARRWSEGSNAANGKLTNGEFLAAAFRDDIQAGRLPQVSWIVAPYRLCEHPQASPALGQSLTAQLIEALADHPEVFAKTAFILNYDENDGFFDHVPPPLPAVNAAMGASTVSVEGEVYKGEPVGFGPRVPMIVVSPWTKGGFVNSEVFDHTSVIRFLEARFGVAEPNISPWRRAVAGDLTSVFDFKSKGEWPREALPATAPLVARAAANAHAPRPVVEAQGATPRQEPGQRPARPLPYQLSAEGVGGRDGVFRLRLDNSGRKGVAFDLRALGGSAGPWFHTVAAGHTLRAELPMEKGYHLALRGPNGFYRTFRGSPAAGPEIEVSHSLDQGGDVLVLTLTNTGKVAQRARVAAGGVHDHGPARAFDLRAGRSVTTAWAIAANAHWYDLVVTDDDNPAFERRLAGHIETGRSSLSDPAIGASARLS